MGDTNSFKPVLFNANRHLLLPFNLRRVLITLVHFASTNNARRIYNRAIDNTLAVFRTRLDYPAARNFSRDTAHFLSRNGVPTFLNNLPNTTLTVCRYTHPRGHRGVGNLLVSNLVTYIINNAARPLRFLFLFMTPILCIVRTLLANLNFAIVSILNIAVNGASNGVVSFIIFNVLRNLSAG